MVQKVSTSVRFAKTLDMTYFGEAEDFLYALWAPIGRSQRPSRLLHFKPLMLTMMSMSSNGRITNIGCFICSL